MAPRRSAEQRRTVTTHTTTTTTTRNESTEHEESENEVQAVQQRPSSHRHSTNRRHASSQQPEQIQTSNHGERSESHRQRNRERRTRTEPHVEQSHATSGRREVRRAEHHLDQSQTRSSHRENTRADRERVQNQEKRHRGEVSRSDRHREQNRDHGREARRRESGGRHRDHAETTLTTTTVRRRNRNQNQTVEQRFRAERQLAEEHQMQQHPEQSQAFHQHAEHDHARVNTTTTTNTTTVTTFNALQESFANGEREEYGDQHQWQELQYQLQLRSQDESLEPSYWQASQQFSFEWLELDPDWESPPGNAYAWYFYQLNIWEAEDYPPIPYEAGRSIAREMAISQGMLEQHDYMIMSLLAGEMSPCPASLSWFVTDVGYICQGHGHFLPHSEIDMVLAGARSNGPYLWDRNFLAWAESDNWYNTEFYGDVRAVVAAVGGIDQLRMNMH